MLISLRVILARSLCMQILGSKNVAGKIHNGVFTEMLIRNLIHFYQY